MSDDFYEPWQRLVRLQVLGRVLEVPENNVLLRQLQYVAPDIGYGRYCWNAECRYCEVSVREPGGREHAALACRIKGQDGLQVLGCAPEIRYNLSQALSRAPKAEPEQGGGGPG